MGRSADVDEHAAEEIEIQGWNVARRVEVHRSGADRLRLERTRHVRGGQREIEQCAADALVEKLGDDGTWRNASSSALIEVTFDLVPPISIAALTVSKAQLDFARALLSHDEEGSVVRLECQHTGCRQACAATPQSYLNTGAGAAFKALPGSSSLHALHEYVRTHIRPLEEAIKAKMAAKLAVVMWNHTKLYHVRRGGPKGGVGKRPECCRSAWRQRGAPRVARFDPADGSHSPIGDDLGDGGDKYVGAVLCDDGCIYALPRRASRALRIDPAKGAAAPFGDDAAALGCAIGWHGTVAGPDGMLYGIPHESTAVLCFDPATGKASAFGSLPEGGFKHTDGVLASDGCIYAAPFTTKRVLRIDPSARTATMIGDELAFSGRGWLTGAAGGDGCLYYPPAQASRVLRVDPTTQTAELIGDELGDGYNWQGAFPGPDGCLYGVPHSDKQLLRIDPIAGTVARVGPPLQDADRNKLRGHATAADGTVWALPHHCPVAPHRFDLPPVCQLLAALLRAPHAQRLDLALLRLEPPLVLERRGDLALNEDGRARR